VSEKKWTPGPWSIRDGGHSHKFGVIAAEDMRGQVNSHILVCEAGDEDDANLIAAAPELYEAIENLLGAIDTPIARRKLGDDFTSQAISEARDALARARGEIEQA